MHREQTHKTIHTLGHAREARRETAEVVADAVALSIGLAQQTRLDHIGYVLAGDAHLLEAVLDPPERVGDKLELWRVEDRLLDPGQEAKCRLRADLAQLTQKV